jgi:hypothetical protein
MPYSGAKSLSEVLMSQPIFANNAHTNFTKIQQQVHSLITGHRLMDADRLGGLQVWRSGLLLHKECLKCNLQFCQCSKYLATASYGLDIQQQQFLSPDPECRLIN